MAQTTRDQLLETAQNLFAERGFYGVSIANIADELGLTKQALLHHFSSKEKLYGEVLERISQEFDRLLATAQSTGDDPAMQFRRFLLGMITKTPSDIVRARLLMRELLDNKRRADTAGMWYLKPFLENLIRMAKAVPAWSGKSDAEALALVYQLLGAVTYYGVSEPTLRGIFGDETFGSLDQAFPSQLDALITSALKRH